MKRFLPCILVVLFVLGSATAATCQEKVTMSGRHVWHTLETLSHQVGEGQSAECYKRAGVGFINETGEVYTITNMYCLYYFGNNIVGGGVASTQSEQGGTVSIFHMNTKDNKRIFRWLSGTGKYQGISGEGTFEAQMVGEGMGYTDWRGEYTLTPK